MLSTSCRHQGGIPTEREASRYLKRAEPIFLLNHQEDFRPDFLHRGIVAFFQDERVHGMNKMIFYFPAFPSRWAVTNALFMATFYQSAGMPCVTLTQNELRFFTAGTTVAMNFSWRHCRRFLKLLCAIIALNESHHFHCKWLSMNEVARCAVELRSRHTRARLTNGMERDNGGGNSPKEANDWVCPCQSSQ